LAPKASSTRIIAGVKNADDLAKQTEIKYGCQFGGSTYRFFKVAAVA